MPPRAVLIRVGGAPMQRLFQKGKPAIRLNAMQVEDAGQCRVVAEHPPLPPTRSPDHMTKAVSGI